MITAIDSAGRLVIPKAYRDAAQLAPGTRVRFRVEPDGLLIEPEPIAVDFERHGRVVVAVPRTAVATLSSEDVEKTIAEDRSRLNAFVSET